MVLASINCNFHKIFATFCQDCHVKLLMVPNYRGLDKWSNTYWPLVSFGNSQDIEVTNKVCPVIKSAIFHIIFTKCCAYVVCILIKVWARENKLFMCLFVYVATYFHNVEIDLFLHIYVCKIQQLQSKYNIPCCW